MVQEISEIDVKKNKEENDDDDMQTLNGDYPKNIENYYALLRAIYESSMQSCEKKSCEAFKENIVGNRICNNNNNSEVSNQQRKNININIKNEADNSDADIIINSLDVSINGSYGNINKVRISCTTTPTKTIPVVPSSPPPPTFSNSNQQIVTSSSTQCDGDTKATRASSSLYHHHHYHHHQGIVAMKNNNKKKFESIIPDDITVALHDYYGNNNSEDDAIDYHTKDIAYNHTKRNSTTGDIKPITSTYLLMTRSMGLTDEDALNLVSCN